MFRRPLLTRHVVRGAMLMVCYLCSIRVTRLRSGVWHLSCLSMHGSHFLEYIPRIPLAYLQMRCI